MQGKRMEKETEELTIPFLVNAIISTHEQSDFWLGRGSEHSPRNTSVSACERAHFMIGQKGVIALSSVVIALLKLICANNSYVTRGCFTYQHSPGVSVEQSC